MTALDELHSRFERQAGLGTEAHLGLEVSLGRLVSHLEMERQERRRVNQAVSMFPFASQPFAVSGGNLLVPTFAADALGPKDGYVWLATRLSVDGLVAGGGLPAAAQGQVTSPGASVTIAQILPANLTPGTYLVNWAVDLDGTPGAGDVNNFKLSGATSGLSVLSANNGAIGHYVQDQVQITIPATNAAALSVKSVVAGTAGAIYSAQIAIIPVQGDQVTLYRGPALTVGAQPQNRIHTFTAGGGTAGPDWTPGGPGLFLAHQDVMTLAGSGLSASSVMLSGDVVCLEADLLAKYLL